MQLTIDFVGVEPNEQTPTVAMYAIDLRGNATKIASLENGRLNLGTDLDRLGKVVALGPDVDDPIALDPKVLVQLRVSDQLENWEKTETITVAPLWWRPWLPITICLSGTVSRCYPLIIDRLGLLRSIALGNPIIPADICYPVCNGVVEIWESTCCWFPFLAIDVPVFLENLKAFLTDNPVMFPSAGRAAQGSRNSSAAATANVNRAIAAGKVDFRFTPNTQLYQDLQVMQSMTAQDAAQYFQQYPRLWPIWRRCSSSMLGEASLNPDGSFSYCYEQYLYPILFCNRSYFYKVKQLLGGVWEYIYDGSAANQYFNADEAANLSTLLGNACGNITPPPPGSDFVILQQIGGTQSYNLHSNYGGVDSLNNDLTQTGPYNVAAPIPASGGLVNDNNAPWCKTLYFMLYFDPGMEGLGAYYYRMSVAPADTNGNPVGAMQPLLNPIAWSYYTAVLVGGITEIEIEPLTLGPNTVGSASGLFRIPYNADFDWLSAQYHQYYDTTTLNPTASGVPGPQNGRFLLAVEIFDISGNRLVPTASVASAGDLVTAFQYLRMMSESGPGSTANVGQAALTHLFWADNRPVVGEIDTFTISGAGATGNPSDAQCQFLSGSSADSFQVGYRAYHAVLSDPNPPNPTPPSTFMSSFSLGWERGLNGPSGTLDSGVTDEPPTRASGVAEESPAANGLLSTLLPAGGPTSCSFAITLNVVSKHTDGSGHFDDLDASVVAAVALSVT